MDDSVECILHNLVGSDNYYEEVLTRLEDPNAIDDMGYTLLHTAAWSSEENSRIVQLLLERGADVRSTTLHGHTPLHFAVAYRKRNTVAAFIEAGASVNSKDFLGRTALHLAIGARSSFPDMWTVDRLLCHPEIDPNTVDEVGNTPLMWAVQQRSLDAVKRLLKKGANPNIPNMIDRNPLHEALSPRNPSPHIVSVLLTNGAGIYCEDIYGQTPMDILVRNVLAHETVLFAKQVVWIIALRYRITESLQRKLEQIPVLSEHLSKCCREVRLMMRQIIYDKFTLHDFALDCFQLRFFDDERDISTPVIKLLSSSSYIEYLNFIFEHMWRVLI